MLLGDRDWLSISNTTQEVFGVCTSLVHYFVCRGREIYDIEILVYNVHSILHITDDADQFSGLDNCSAFKFEEYLYTMNKMVRNGTHPLRQFAKRLEERQSSVLQYFKEREIRNVRDKHSYCRRMAVRLQTKWKKMEKCFAGFPVTLQYCSWSQANLFL